MLIVVFVFRPNRHDCRLVDLNSDGIYECLVVGDRGLLAAVNPVEGEEVSQSKLRDSFQLFVGMFDTCLVWYLLALPSETNAIENI